MKPLVALFVGALLVGPVPAVTVEGNRVILDADEQKVCADGGCYLVHKAALHAFIEQQRAMAAHEATEIAGQRSRDICWRIT